MRIARLLVTAATIALALAAGSTSGEAHKPITSPFTFNEDVFPIVQARCAACHVRGGVAPMSLLTHADAVPWGESIRAELMAGHMPPWGLDSPPSRFRNVQGLTARELNILLTWASGGTPAGDPEKAPAPVPVEKRWPLGPPDLVLDLPEEVTLAEDVQERIVEFTVAAAAAGDRLVRAVDLLPGNPAIVRSATISLKNVEAGLESMLALWVPGDHPVALDQGAAFRIPAGAELAVRVRYRKTWEYEREVMRDRSSVGLYFAEGASADVLAIPLTVPDRSQRSVLTLSSPARVIAIYPDSELVNRPVVVGVTKPGGDTEELIAFRPLQGWARRYWFREPILLPAGTRLQMTAFDDEEQLLPPGAIPLRTPPAGNSPARVVVNVVPAD